MHRSGAISLNDVCVWFISIRHQVYMYTYILYTLCKCTAVYSVWIELRFYDHDLLASAMVNVARARRAAILSCPRTTYTGVRSRLDGIHTSASWIS